MCVCRHPLWSTVRDLLTTPDLVKVCFDSVPDLATLVLLGVPIHTWVQPAHTDVITDGGNATANGTPPGKVGAAGGRSTGAAGLSQSRAASQQQKQDGQDPATADLSHTVSFIDPQVLHGLLNCSAPGTAAAGAAPPAAAAVTAKDVTDSLLPMYRLHVQLGVGEPAMRAAADTCARAYSCSAAQEALLHALGLFGLYQSTELSVLVGRAYSRAAWLYGLWQTQQGTHQPPQQPPQQPHAHTASHQPAPTAAPQHTSGQAKPTCQSEQRDRVLQGPAWVWDTEECGSAGEAVATRLAELRRALRVLVPAATAAHNVPASDHMGFVVELAKCCDLHPTAAGQQALAALRASAAGTAGAAEAAGAAGCATAEQQVDAAMRVFAGSDAFTEVCDTQYALAPEKLFFEGPYASRAGGPVAAQAAWLLTQMLCLLRWSTAHARSAPQAKPPADPNPATTTQHDWPGWAHSTGSSGAHTEHMSTTDLVLCPDDTRSIQHEADTSGVIRLQGPDLVLFDAEQATLASTQQLNQAGLLVDAAGSGEHARDAAGAVASQAPTRVGARPGCTALCAGVLLAVLPTHASCDPCPHDACRYLGPTALISVSACGDQGVAAHNSVWAAPAHSVWRHSTVSWAGLQEDAAQAGRVADLLQVQVPLCSPSAWLTLRPMPGWGVLHVQTPLLPLHILAALSNDPVLVHACEQTDPLGVLTHALCAAGAGAATTAAAGVAGLAPEPPQPPDSLAALLSVCTHLPPERRVRWATLQLLAAFAAGEGAAKLAQRLEPTDSSGTGAKQQKRMPRVPRALAVKLSESFMACLPTARAWCEGLLGEALKSAG